MRIDPDDLAALVRRAEAAGSTVLRTVVPELAPGPFPARAGNGPARHEFTVPGWRPVLKNEIKRVGHWGFARLKKRDRIAVAAWSTGVPKAAARRRVSAEITLAGRMMESDEDAPLWSLLDALVAAGLLVDDSPRWCKVGDISQVRGTAKATRIVLEDLEDR